MAFALVVVHAFEGRSVGDMVTDAVEIASVVQGEHATRAVRILTPTRDHCQNEDN